MVFRRKGSACRRPIFFPLFSLLRGSVLFLKKTTRMSRLRNPLSGLILLARFTLLSPSFEVIPCFLPTFGPLTFNPPYLPFLLYFGSKRVPHVSSLGFCSQKHQRLHSAGLTARFFLILGISLTHQSVAFFPGSFSPL